MLNITNMKLSELPQPLQELAIKRMKEQDPSVGAAPYDCVDSMFVFADTPEQDEWEAIQYHKNLEPMYAKYPELRS